MDPSERASETPAGETMSDDVALRNVSVEALRTLKYEIEREVALGLLWDREIVWNSVDRVLMHFDADEAALTWHGERILRAAMAEHARQQATWPVTTDCHRLDAAFAELEEARILLPSGFYLRRGARPRADGGSHQRRGEIRRPRPGFHLLLGRGRRRGSGGR